VSWRHHSSLVPTLTATTMTGCFQLLLETNSVFQQDTKTGSSAKAVISTRTWLSWKMRGMLKISSHTGLLLCKRQKQQTTCWCSFTFRTLESGMPDRGVAPSSNRLQARKTPRKNQNYGQRVNALQLGKDAHAKFQKRIIHWSGINVQTMVSPKSPQL